MSKLLKTLVAFFVTLSSAQAQLGPKIEFSLPKITQHYSSYDESGNVVSKEMSKPGRFDVTDISETTKYEDHVLLPLTLGSYEPVGNALVMVGKGDPILFPIYNLITMNDANNWASDALDSYFRPAAELQSYDVPNLPEQVVMGQINSEQSDKVGYQQIDYVVRGSYYLKSGQQGYLKVYMDSDGLSANYPFHLEDYSCTNPKLGTSGNYFTDTTIYDYNQDTLMDVIASNNCGQIIVFLRNKEGGFEGGNVVYTFSRDGYIVDFAIGTFGLTGEANVTNVAAAVLLKDEEDPAQYISWAIFLKQSGANLISLAQTNLDACAMPYQLVDGELDGSLSTSDFAISCTAGRNNVSGKVFVLHKTSVRQVIDLGAPQGIDLGDINGDHKADLAVALRGINSIAVLRGNKQGCFESHGCENHKGETATYVKLVAPPENVKIYDFNEDGLNDIGLTTRVIKTQNISRRITQLNSATTQNLINSQVMYNPDMVRDNSLQRLVTTRAVYGDNVVLNPDNVNRVYSQAMRGAYVPLNEVANYQIMSEVAPTNSLQISSNISKLLSQDLPPNENVAPVVVVNEAIGDSFQVLITTQVVDPGVVSSAIACDNISTSNKVLIQATPPANGMEHPINIEIKSIIPNDGSFTIEYNEAKSEATIIFTKTNQDYVVTAVVIDTVTQAEHSEQLKYAFATACPGAPIPTPIPTPTAVPESQPLATPTPIVTPTPTPLPIILSFNCPAMSVEGFEGDVVEVCTPIVQGSDVSVLSVTSVQVKQVDKLDKIYLNGTAQMDASGCIQMQMPIYPFNVPYTQDKVQLSMQVNYSVMTANGSVNQQAVCNVAATTILRSVEGAGACSINHTSETHRFLWWSCFSVLAMIAFMRIRVK